MRFYCEFNNVLIILLSIKVITVDAQLIEKYFGSSWIFMGICIFSAFIAVLLGYSCVMDIRHWKRSIDVKLQSKFPEAKPSDFEQEPSKFAPALSENEEDRLVTPPDESSLRLESTQMATTEAEKPLVLEKHIKIIQAMYSSSGRELPDSFQQNAESRRFVSKSKPPVVKMETISELPNETNSDQGSVRKKSSKE